MSQIIEHSGFVYQINGKHIKVQILQESACSGCHAKGSCTAADMADKFIDVESDDAGLKVGQAVTVYGQSSLGLLAVLLAFVIPFLLVLITLFFLNNKIENEAISGTIALGTLLPYFIILSFFNKKLKSKLKFHIKRKDTFGDEF
ncbi:MAG: SoxR reducing system RseC family protein [Paludibacter sp.]|nr:SoxR reducing system RseC family protein [Paludibacter sp.]